MSEDDLNYGTTYDYPATEGIPGIDDSEVSGGKIFAGSTVTDITVGGFVEFSTPVKVLSRTATSVVWQAPIKEIAELIVTVSDGSATPVYINYEVVM